MLPDKDTLKRDIARIVLTCSIALAVGYAFLRFSSPAPFLMGSLFGVWIAGGVFPAMRPHLGIPRWLHIPVVLGVGVLIGANFNTGLLDRASEWIVTASAVLATTVIVTLIGMGFLIRLRRYPPDMAFLCSIPGGQVEVITAARELIDKDYVVALFQLIRVATIFTATPLLLTLIEGREAVAESNIRLAGMPGIGELAAGDLIALAAIAIGGYGAARLMRLPLPYLLGPMLLSTGLHVAGVVAIPRVFELVMLAQLVIGGGLGARLAGVRFRTLASYLGDGIVMGMIILGCYALAAAVMASVTDTGFMNMLLAFVPGGLYEVTLLAIIFGFDVAFIVFHSTVRVMLIFITMPLIVAGRMRAIGKDK